MTTTELRAYCRNIYAACKAEEAAGNLVTGDAGPLARIIIQAQLVRENADIPKV